MPTFTYKLNFKTAYIWIVAKNVIFGMAEGKGVADVEKERTIIVEFSSVEKAEEFYNSPEYKVALDALEGGAVRSFKICEAYE